MGILSTLFGENSFANFKPLTPHEELQHILDIVHANTAKDTEKQLREIRFDVAHKWPHRLAEIMAWQETGYKFNLEDRRELAKQEAITASTSKKEVKPMFSWLRNPLPQEAQQEPELV